VQSDKERRKAFKRIASFCLAHNKGARITVRILLSLLPQFSHVRSYTKQKEHAFACGDRQWAMLCGTPELGNPSPLNQKRPFVASHFRRSMSRVFFCSTCRSCGVFFMKPGGTRRVSRESGRFKLRSGSVQGLQRFSRCCGQ
jgi:hypothetical protein